MNRFKYLHNSKGLTLVEAVASILLISVILITFSTFILSSKNTSIASEKIVDATYIAQHELESIYEKSKNTKIETLIKDPTFCSPTGTSIAYADKTICTRQLNSHPYIKDPTTYNITITFIKSTNNTLLDSNYHNVVVEVKEKQKSKSIMEGLYPFLK